MADKKTTELTAASAIETDDLVMYVDVSDTTMAASGTNKKVSRELLQTYNAGTLTTDKKVLDLSATWNAAGVTFTGVKFNVTNTASASGSKVFDFQIGGTSAFILDRSGNLLVNTTSQVGSAKLTVAGSIYASTATFATGGQLVTLTGNDSSINYVGAASRSNGAWVQLFGRDSASNANSILFGNGNSAVAVELMRLDSSGNLGLGVTPSVNSLSKGLDLVGGAGVFGYLLNSYWTTNTYYDGAFKYKASGFASYYAQGLGAHTWYTAPSGTAGNAISFTERLQITNGGLLTFGGTTSSFPALKRSSTTLQVRLADDSGDAPFTSGRATIQGLTVGLGGQTAVANNTAVGLTALNNVNLTGDSNTAFGSTALRDTSTGASNSAFGHAALVQNTTGSNNSALGQAALFSVTTAGSNSAFGSQALRYFNTSNNVAVGYEAVRGSTTVANNTGDSLVGVGYRALYSNTSGLQNSAVGGEALLNNTTGQFNAAFGYGALTNNTTASNNSAVGRLALLYFNTSNNVAVGYGALLGGSTTVANNTGANNIAIGYQAGNAITSGSNNIVIGHDIDPDSATGSSQINIGDRYFHDRIRLLERTSDPAKPAEGNMIVWMSDGTGLGDDGDVIIASTAGGVTNYAILFDHSAGTVWP